MARIAEFLKLPVVLSALLATAGAAAAQAGEPSSGNCKSLDKTVRGKVLDARLRGNRYRIKILDENGRVKIIEIDVTAVCNPPQWRFYDRGPQEWIGSRRTIDQCRDELC
jgi:hypothetical protein